MDMFIKKTSKTDLKTGKRYFAYHLVESVRTEKGPRQRTLLYMGSEIELPEGDHKLLAQRIEGIIQGEQPLLPYPDDIERLAQGYASQVVDRLSTSDESSALQENKEPEPEFVSINVNSIEKSNPRSVGAEDLMLNMANQLELPKQLKKLGLSTTDASIALGSIIARAVYPDSERSTYDWLCNDSGLGELIDFDFNNIPLARLCTIFELIFGEKLPAAK